MWIITEYVDTIDVLGGVNRMDQDLTSEIISKILNITAFMKAEDYIKMLEKVNIEVFVSLSDKERYIYETLEKTWLLVLRIMI